MARISYEAFEKASMNETRNDANNISFFGLKNDGDEAVVRIMHDSPEDFDIIGVHTVKVGDRFRKVGCLRDVNDPVDKCPLCKAGVDFKYRFYVHMLQYITDENGNIICKPVVWDRSAKQMSRELMDKLNEYGPLSDVIFKIKRSGKANEINTKYSINFANPQVYRPDLYEKNEEVFKNYTAFGNQVMDKSFDEIQQFMNTGSFPERKDNKDINIDVNNEGEVGVSYSTTSPTYTNHNIPTTNATPSATRPNRYY